MTTFEENGHEESLQTQVAVKHGPQDKIEKNIEESIENASLEQANQQDKDLHEKELGKLEENDASRESVQVPPPDLPNKDGNLPVPGEEEVIESEQARIERLGRERPAKFKSLGAELAFCYSIIASQFMAVCINGSIADECCKPVLLTNNRNTSYLVSMYSSQLL